MRITTAARSTPTALTYSRPCRRKNVGLIVDPGCDLESSRAAIALAEKYDFVYAAVGWHPEDMDKLTDEGFDEMIKLMHHPKCVAVGEIGA